MVIQQARKLESLAFTLNLNADQWMQLNLSSLENLKQLRILQVYPRFSNYASKLNEVVSTLKLEVIEYPRLDRFYWAYNAPNSEDWDCQKAAFPPTIKKIKNFRTRSFAGLHSCLNLESLSVVAYPKNQNLEELHGLAKLQEFFVLPTGLVMAKQHEPGLTDEAINYLKHATGLHTLSFGFGWGGFTNLADIHRFKHLR